MTFGAKPVLSGGNCTSQGWEVGRSLVSSRCSRCCSGGREGGEAQVRSRGFLRMQPAAVEEAGRESGLVGLCFKRGHLGPSVGAALKEQQDW